MRRKDEILRAPVGPASKTVRIVSEFVIREDELATQLVQRYVVDLRRAGYELRQLPEWEDV